MTTRRGFLGWLGAVAAAPVAIAAAKLLPKSDEIVGYKMEHKATILNKNWAAYEDPYLDECVQRMAEQAVKTREDIMWNAMKQYGGWIPIS